MKARLISRASEPEGLAVVSVAGVDRAAIDRLGRGPSTQPVPAPGTEFDASFSYLLDFEAEPRLLPADAPAAASLSHRDGCSYDAVGKILSVDSETEDRRVLVAKVDCGGCVLPAPIDVIDPAHVGRLVAFTIAQLEVWRA